MTEATKSLCEFIDASTTNFHAVENIKAKLAAHGARELDEREPWELEPGVVYCLSRGASLVAFRSGMRSMGDSGFVLAGAHTDSPCLKIRQGKEPKGKNLLRLAVEVYGSPIVSGWLDRPLHIAGRLLVEDSGSLKEVLYDSGRPLAVIPNLPIHLNREINKGFEYNAHTHLPALVQVLAEQEGGEGAAAGSAESWMRTRAAEDLGLDPAAVKGYDLQLSEGRNAFVLGGEPYADGSRAAELVNAPRLDDLAGCHAILEAFLSSPPTHHTQIACFLDAEEIGSRTAEGADSSFLRDIISRIHIASKAGPEDFYRASARSFILSVDGAQAWNPAYPEKFDESDTPLLGGGPAVKVNALKRYATDMVADAAVRDRCRRESIPCQRYMVRSDMTPGSTIGPISSARLGARTVDIGHPLLSMHAIRETIDSADHVAMTTLIASLLEEPPSTDR